MSLPVLRSSRAPERWDPFREFEELYTQMGNWMDSAIGRGGDSPGWSPLADVIENEEDYLVEVELPGVKRDDISIELIGDEISVSGTLHEKERAGLVRRRTRRTGEFAYRVRLPGSVDADKVEAKLDDGVLTIRVPKVEAEKPRRIAITAS